MRVGTRVRTPSTPRSQGLAEMGLIHSRLLDEADAADKFACFRPDEPLTRKLKAQYPCWCGSKPCRGTMLAPKRASWRKR